jgi:hypothetical protein
MLLVPGGTAASPQRSAHAPQAAPGNAASQVRAVAAAPRKRSRRLSRRDFDRDGIPNGRDRDMDGDRIPNRRDRDMDGDGRSNRRDRNLDGDRKRNSRDRNIDGDSKRNGRDREMDADRIRNSRDRDIDADWVKNCPNDRDMDADRIPNSRDRDMDADGIPNARDPDIDSDGRPNGSDSDMDCDRIPNRFDPDIDGDGLVNYLDPDSDADGISESGELPEGVRLPRNFFGLVAPHAYAAEGAPRFAQLNQIATTGVGTLRHTFEWSDVEKAPGIYDFGLYDSFVGDAARYGFTVLPILFDPPSFRSSRPASGANRGTYPPASNADFATFAARMVRRYGPAGTFWLNHPLIPRHPIGAWQIWNEPHLNVYWPAGPNPAAYTVMLKTVSAGIKQADPRAEVIAGAISQSNLGVPLASFLQGMYDAGARDSFDSIGVHPYAPAADQVAEIMLEVRRIADRNGDPGAALRVTELGWSTGGPPSPFRTDRVGQAELIRRSWAALVRRQGQLKLAGLIYFGWRDLIPYAPLFQDFFGLHTGLLELDGRDKPARAAFADVVHALSAR